MYDWIAALSVLAGTALLVGSLTTISPTDPRSLPSKRFFIPSTFLLALGVSVLAFRHGSDLAAFAVALATGYLLRGVVYLYRR